MFEVGFGELVLIALVALVVVGPERLPRLARTAGLWVGRARRMIISVKADIEREMKAEELKEILHKQARSNPLEEIIEEGKSTLKELRHSAGPAAGNQGPSSETPPTKRPAE